ncbi:hypothetical protein V6Z11_D04G106000 [Gossypium hirsutum]
MHQISCLPLFDSFCSYDMGNHVRFSMACSLRITERESPSISASLSPRFNPRLSA